MAKDTTPVVTKFKAAPELICAMTAQIAGGMMSYERTSALKTSDIKAYVVPVAYQIAKQICSVVEQEA